MPWAGYNSEDAVLISERPVYGDLIFDHASNQVSSAILVRYHGSR